MEKVKLAVIGAGGIANGVHLPSLSDMKDICEVTAICDLEEEKAKQAAAKYNIPKTYRWHMDMLEKEKPDGILCLVQPDLMYRVAHDCLAAGNNILMEKPAGINSYQAESIARLAAKTGKICAVAMNRRHVPLVQKVFSVMKELTAITQVDGCFIKFSDVAEGWHYADAFVCDIVHAVDLVRYLAGGEPVKAATVIARNNSPVDNAWSSVIAFDNGITGTLRANYQTAARFHNFEIHGPKASAYINLGFPRTMGCDATIVHSAGKPIYSQAAVGAGGQLVEHIDGIALAGGNNQLYAHYGYMQEDIDFVECIKTGRKPLCSIEDAAKSMSFVEMLLNNRIN
jgi:predicted dehydrogenase